MKLKPNQHQLLQADISNEDEVQSMMEAFEERYGRLDILVNNAGIWEAHPIDAVSFDTWKTVWKRTIDTNLIACANLCYLASQNMIKHGGGRVVNISSRGAFRGEPDAIAYGASKAGLNALSQSLCQSTGQIQDLCWGSGAGFCFETDMAMENLTEAEIKAHVGDLAYESYVKSRRSRPCCLVFGLRRSSFYDRRNY